MRIIILLYILFLPLLSLGQTSWTGVTSTAWNTASNWTGGVPSASTVAIIGNASFIGSFQPAITTGTARCLSLTIGNGAVVSNLSNSRRLIVGGNVLIGINGTMTHTASEIQVAGNWTNNGTYNVTGGTTQVTFNGSVQSITGATTFRRLEISTGSTTSLNFPITVTGRFQPLGSFDPGNNLVTLTGATFILRNSSVLLVQASTFSGNYSISPTSINNNSEVEYASSTADQSITVIGYGNLVLSGTSVKTFSGATTQVNNFTNSSSFTIQDGSTLQLQGDWVNNGTFNSNANTIEFIGTAAQDVSGTSNTTFNNILVSNTSNNGVRIQSDQNLRGVLTLAANTTLDADGQANTSIFTLLSSADNSTIDGHIAALPAGAQVTGNVTIQRFMSIEGSNSTRIYRYISSPVQSATVADIQNEIPITGSFTGTSTCTGCNTNASMFLYDETVTGDLNNGYVAFPTSTNTETLSSGLGYAMFVRGNILGSGLWDVSGPINAGNVAPISFPVAFTSSAPQDLANDGWNLVGNPFPSTIDWSAASGWTKTNIDGSIYITDNGGTSLQFATWNGTTGTNGGSRYIAMGQGFWIKANGLGAPVLTADENVKSAGTQTIFFKANPPSNLLRITLTLGSTRDEAVIHFRDDATNSFDSHADAMKLKNATFNISSLQADAISLAINSMPPLDCDATVPLLLENVKQGSYQLSFSEYDSFGDYVSIVLHDKWLESITTIQSSTYDFDITSEPASFAKDRFEIIFNTLPLQHFDVNAETSICEDIDYFIQLDNAREGAIYEAKIGNGDFSSFNLSGNTANLSLSTKGLKSGIYKIEIVGKDLNCSNQIKQEIQLEITELSTIISTQSTVACGGGSVTLTANANDVSFYNWFDSKDASNPIATTSEGMYVTGHLSKSKTYHVEAINQSGCKSERQPVKAMVSHVDPVKISIEDDLLLSNYNSSNKWYYNNQRLSNEVNNTLKPTKNGKYKVEIEKDGCIVADEIEFTSKNNIVDEMVQVYPNPFASDLRFDFTSCSESKVEIHIRNLEGKLIKSACWTREDDAEILLDLSGQPNGIYIVTLVGVDNSTEVRVVKK